MNENIAKTLEIYFQDNFDKSGGDPEEVKREIKNLLSNLNVNNENIDEIYKEADLDGNGNVDINELLEYLAKKTSGIDLEDELLEAFKLFDTDGTGLISMEKLKGIFTNLKDVASPEEIDEILAIADLDNDGYINYEEFLKVINNK